MANLRIGRRSGLVLRGGKNRRSTLWFSGVESRTNITTVSTAVLLTSLNAAALALRPFTVVRTRGVISLKSDQSIATEDQLAAYGECVVSDQASAAGVASVPTPVTDSGSELWLVYEWLINDVLLLSSVGLHVTSKFLQFDSRAMRKVDEGMDLISVVESGALSNGFRFSTFARTLVKLH